MIYLGADHRGYQLKEKIKERLTEEGYQWEDLGNDQLDVEDDYVDFAQKVSEKVLEDPQSNRGILLCGSGVGMDIVANKFPGIRSALVYDVARAKQSREHEDINVISLPADVLNEAQAWAIVQTFLTTSFSNEIRHQRRLSKLAQIEKILSKKD